MIRHLYYDPRYMILIILLIIISGLAGFKTRPKLEDPKSEVRKGCITTFFPGASPSEIESQVSEPIENALHETKGIRSIESFSQRGVSIVFVRLTDEVVNVTESWSKLKDKLSEITGSLPEGATVPKIVDERRWDSYTAVVALRNTGDSPVPSSVLSRWAKELENRLRYVPGTRFTELFGMPEEEILVEVEEETLAATGLTINEIAGRINARDSDIPDGFSQTLEVNIPVRLSGDIEELNSLRNVLIKGTPDGNHIRLQDIGIVKRSEKTPSTNSCYVNGKRAVAIASRMDVDYIINDWTANYYKELLEFQGIIPGGLEAEVIFSQKDYTDLRSETLFNNLILGLTLIVILVWMILGWRSAIPICSALPLTLLGVFFLMIPFGISFHQMSIAGLILATGMLIDNPIIIVDDIQRRIEKGCPAPDSIVKSIKHLTKPLIGSNLTTILGFTPILLIPGTTGEYLGQMAWAVIASLAVSLILSLTIIPVIAGWSLCSLKKPIRSKKTFKGIYKSSLRLLFSMPKVTICFTVFLPLLGFVFAGELKEQFFPQAERNQLHFSIRLPTYSSIRDTERISKKACDIVSSHPDVQDVALFIGTNAPMIHYSMLAVDENRPDYAQAIVQVKGGIVDPVIVHQLQEELDKKIPEAQSLVTLIERGPPTVAPIEYRLYGPSLDQLEVLSDKAREIMMSIPGIIHTRTSLDCGGPKISLEVKQHEAESAGFTDKVVASQIQSQLEGLSFTSLSEQNEETPILVRIKNGDIANPERVISLPVISEETSGVVPLGSIADWSVKHQLFNISRRNSLRSNIIYGFVAAGELPVELEKKFKESIKSNNFTLPTGYSFDFGGVSQERNSAVGNLLAYAAIIGVLMVSVLVITFKSFRKAGIIGLVGILSVGLGLLSLWLFNFPMGIASIIGLLGMMGLAINDSIVVICDAENSMDSPEALAASVTNSTRHVLTTSITTVAGVTPLILAGGNFFPPMQIVIAGGVVGATLLALGFTPSVFYLIFKNKTKQQNLVIH